MKTGDIFRHNLRDLREKKGFTQKSLAEKVGLNDQAIREYEAGRRFPPVETLGQIATELGVNVSDLFNFKESEPVAVLQFSKVLHALAEIPDHVLDMAIKIGKDNNKAWETVEAALENAIEDMEAKKSKKS